MVFTPLQMLLNKTFTVSGISTDPGELFLNQVNQRTTQQQIETLPTVQRSKATDSFAVYRVQENKPHVLAHLDKMVFIMSLWYVHQYH